MTQDYQLVQAFQARHLAVPMSQAISVRSDESAQVAIDRLRPGRFDQAPVIDDGRIVGYVLTRWLPTEGSARVGEILRPLGSGNVVSADASVGELLEWIIEPGFLFVLEGREVTGFVTVSDFNKQPARAYIYLLLAALETGLAELVRRRFANDQRAAVELLSDEAGNQVLERYAGDVEVGDESELVAYFDFSDLIAIVGNDTQLRNALEFASKTKWRDQLGGLVDLRNAVMHPVRNMVLAKRGLEDLHRRANRVLDLLERVDLAVSRLG